MNILKHDFVQILLKGLQVESEKSYVRKYIIYLQNFGCNYEEQTSCC